MSTQKIHVVQKHRNIALKGSGWKNISLVDVYGSVTFTLWLCGCNLKCPFCHNWRLAVGDVSVCKRLDIDKLIEELSSAKLFIDYFHITGGEPLVQHRDLHSLLTIIRDNIGVKISLNTNMTLIQPLKKIIDDELVDHVATDIKIPPTIMYGYDEIVAEKLWNLYMKSLEYVSDKGIRLELRVPIARNISLKTFREYASIAYRVLSRHKDYYVIIQPLLGEPVTNPRNTEWCKTYCDPEHSILDEVASIFRDIGYEKVYVRKTIFG